MAAVLTLLRIRNLALVEELEWQMVPGFIAVTGETGAGKSIIIGALQLLLGETKPATPRRRRGNWRGRPYH
jgi:DNA repair ATPase RecN